MSRIYVASSWRNERQPEVVTALRAAGHEVYDFRDPGPPDSPHIPSGVGGFAWSEIDPAWQSWTPEQYVAALRHPIARRGFGHDFAAMQWADTVVLVQPCGRSAHLELGWAWGAGKRTIVLLAEGQEPELMVADLDYLCTSLDEVLAAVVDIRPSRESLAHGVRRLFGSVREDDSILSALIGFMCWIDTEVQEFEARCPACGRRAQHAHDCYLAAVVGGGAS